ncbi:MAG: L-threonylcarbamoyladenylate synthase [Steroidobacteraceae bacterium]
MVKVLRASPAELAAAVQALRDGELVAFPTETVYGLGAHAAYPAALRRIFDLKGRPTSHPLIVHIDSPRYLTRWAREVPEAAQKLAQRFWPGPLTLVLPRAENVHRLVTGGQDTVAVRVPAHPMAQQLLTAFGGGIAAPSANRYGHVSPTRAEHVREEFGTDVRVVLDGGDCKLGLESTIVACLDGKVQLLRPGGITLSQLEQAVGAVQTEAAADAPRVPGSTDAHYAPATPLSVVPSGELEDMVAALTEAGVRIGVLAQHPPVRTYALTTWINGGLRHESYAHDLYANLRKLDKAGCARILVQQVPADERWDAAYDRLHRASAGRAHDANDGSNTLAVGVPG